MNARTTKTQLAAENSALRERVSQLEADLARANENTNDLRAQILELERRCEAISADETQPLEVPATGAKPSAPVNNSRSAKLEVMRSYALTHRVITSMINGVPSFYDRRIGQWLDIPQSAA